MCGTFTSATSVQLRAIDTTQRERRHGVQTEEHDLLCTTLLHTAIELYVRGHFVLAQVVTGATARMRSMLMTGPATQERMAS